MNHWGRDKVKSFLIGGLAKNENKKKGIPKQQSGLIVGCFEFFDG